MLTERSINLLIAAILTAAFVIVIYTARIGGGEVLLEDGHLLENRQLNY